MNQYCLRYYCDGQTNKGTNGARSMVPLHAHSYTGFHCGGGLYFSALVDFSPLVSARFEEPELKSTNGSDTILLFHESHLFVVFFCFLLFCFFLFFVQQCHLQRHEAHEHGKQKLLSLRIWLCVLSGAAPSYLSSAKVPIDWAADCASVSLPVQPSLRPSPPSLHPTPPAAQGLID